MPLVAKVRRPHNQAHARGDEYVAFRVPSATSAAVAPVVGITVVRVQDRQIKRAISGPRFKESQRVNQHYSATTSEYADRHTAPHRLANCKSVIGGAVINHDEFPVREGLRTHTVYRPSTTYLAWL